MQSEEKMSPPRIPVRTLPIIQFAGQAAREESASQINEKAAAKATEPDAIRGPVKQGSAKSRTRSPYKELGRRLDLTGMPSLKVLGMSSQLGKVNAPQDPGGLTADPKKGNSLADRAALERIKSGGVLSETGLAIVENPRFQDPGQCHINALQLVHAHSSSEVVSHSLELISHLNQRSKTEGEPQRTLLGQVTAAFQVLMHLKVSATGRPSHGFENAEKLQPIDTLEAMAAFVKDRGALVAQGSGRAVTAADSDLRKPLPAMYAIQIGQPVLRESDGSVNKNHSVVVLAVATQSDPVPGLELGQCLVFDQDPNRACIVQALERAGLSQTPPYQLTPAQIKEAGVDYLMTRVVSFDDLSQITGTGNLGVFPLGGLVGGRFFVSVKTDPP